jgi:hypothetical protein
MENEKVFRPSIGTQLFLGIVWLALFVLSLFGYLAGSVTVMYVVVSGLVLLGFILWATTVKISVTAEGVTHHSGFGRQSGLFWPEITEVSTRAELSGSRGKYETILRSNTPSKKEIRINIKLFGKRDLVEFATMILGEARGATVDETTRAMAQGTMPSMFRAQRPAS